MIEGDVPTFMREDVKLLTRSPFRSIDVPMGPSTPRQALGMLVTNHASLRFDCGRYGEESFGRSLARSLQLSPCFGVHHHTQCKPCFLRPASPLRQGACH